MTNQTFASVFDALCNTPAEAADNADYGGQLQGGLWQQVRYGLPVFGIDARVFVHGFPFLVLTK